MCVNVGFCVDSGASWIASIVVSHRVLPTGTCSTGSLRVHDVKQEVAETFHAIYQCREYVLSQPSGMHRKVPGMPHHVSDT